MPLQPGDRFGPYEVVVQIGEGGMGEVYQARDTTLNRDVAIKVLPAALADDPDRLARFQREAESLAALNHPNIATVHGLERSGETPAIVMELVDGPTLADRLRAGPLTLDEALAVGRQVADALDAAHERGIVHRDLKPANIKVKANGTVKVLDFGLAKALDPATTGDGANPANSPTVTSPALTQMGLILGTAAYMSPEQAKGRPVDTRADIWAFGCVLYEMLSGRQTWGGETVTDVIAALVAREPDWNRLPSTVPPRLRFLLERCLEKDAAKRTQHIGEVRAELERAASDPTGGIFDGRTAARPAGLASRVGWPLVTLAALVAAVAMWMSSQPGSESPVWLAAVHPGPEVPGGNHFNANLAISPDGTRLAYTTTTAVFNLNEMPLYARALGERDPRLLAESARAPFFSPNGDWVGFVADNGPLMKVAFTGGPAVRIGGDANANRGISWGPDGTIVFAASDTSRGLSRISDAGGGEEQALTTPDADLGEVDHLFPAFLPGGDALLFTIRDDDGGFNVAVLDLEAGTYETLIPGASDARYASSGHIVYGVEGTLRAVAFDVDRRETRGTPVPVADGLVTWLSGAASFAIADNGTLAYIAGEAQGQGARLGSAAFVAVDREGRSFPLSDERRAYGSFRLSPEGRRIAVEVFQGQGNAVESHVWIVDRASGLGTQLTFAGSRNRYPVWSADGRSIFFASNRDAEAPGSLYRQAADFSSEATSVYRSEASIEPEDLLSERTLFVTEVLGPQSDIRLLDLEQGTLSDFLVAPEVEYGSRVSPDGRWVAYVSRESGQSEVYVRPAPPGGGAQRRVSDGGGSDPLWSPKGDELYFMSRDLELMSVPIELEPTFSAGRPESLFSVAQFDWLEVAPDGRFVGTRNIPDPASDGADASQPRNQLIVVQHWFEVLKERVPVR